MRKFFFLLLIFCGGSLLAAQSKSPRERLLMDFGWRFHLGEAPDAGTKFDYKEIDVLPKTHLDEIGKQAELDASQPDPVAANLGSDVSFAQPNFDDSGWRKLDLPHDWAVELPFNEKADYQHGFKAIGKGFPENNIGWYRRTFELPAADKGKTLWLEFDGVYRNSLVWLNGHCLGRHPDGYGSFYYDISKLAKFGGKNSLVVRVDASRVQGWFYEGAGIYRHVWLVKTAPVHVAHWGTFVASSVENENATVTIQTRFANNAAETKVCSLIASIVDGQGKSLAELKTSGIEIKGEGEQSAKQNFVLKNPKLWSPESPNLYKLISTIESDGRIVDRTETEFGIRTIAFDAEKGFLLNGKPYVIKGTCNHQDHAGVGTAMPDALQYFRVKKLKEMGSNAYRTSHNPPTPELLEACDRLGMLVMDETRRMDTTPEALGELESLIVRDRNHPSVFIWALGNEEFYLQGRRGTNTDAQAHEAAIRIVTPMQELAHRLDPTRPCTVAMNGGWGEGFSKVVDVQGFNYRTANISKFRAENPTKPCIGTETASTRVTRGIYVDDKERGYVASYGSNGVERAWQWWSYYATNPFTSGGFVWTGFDYRGEPTPYRWPCINSHFGVMDTCGFPKDLFYYYKSWWGNEPVLHILPHWNWPGKEGQKIAVRVFSNCQSVELFLNGKSLGKKSMPLNEYLDWEVNYEPGVLSAKGFDGQKVITESQVATTDAPAAIELSPDRKTVRADNEDISIVNVAVVDRKGRAVPTADNQISFEVRGGKILGVGNGDPSSHEPDKAGQRKVFCGYAQVILQPTQRSGKMELIASSPGLKTATIKIGLEKTSSRPAAQ